MTSPTTPPPPARKLPPTTPPPPAPKPTATVRRPRTSASVSRRSSDPEARFTRNVTIAFVFVIVATATVVIAGLAYGFWETNLKALANVDGTEIGRGEWEDRQRLDAFRADRADTTTRALLLAGDIDEDLADRRLTESANARASTPAAAMETLVDLIFQGQLAAEQGITLSEDDLATALTADGTFPETRRVSALVIQPTGAATGQSTAEDRAAARERAEEALAALRAGTDIADLVDEYSPATAANDGDLGYGTLEDLQGIDPAWAEALFSLEEGGITDILEGQTGDLLIGVVTSTVPETPDEGFLAAVREQVGEAVHTRNVERETLSAKLEDKITADVVEADYEQVKLAEILVAGDTTVAPEGDEGSVRASHILYQPEPADPDASPAPADTDASPAPADTDASAAPADTDASAAPADPDASPAPTGDPAWAEAQARAEETAAELRAIEDVEARMAAFASRAETDGTDATAQTGGDLGFFERGDMVPEFADAIFDAEDPRQGDIIGPVRSEFGWHVIMYNESRAPIAERLATVQDALAAPGADFAAVAAELSDGPEAAAGGEIGWQPVEDLDEITSLALSAIDIGATTEPIDDARGYVIYQKQDEATRPLEPDDAAAKARFAFSDWYDEQRFDAEDAGRISIDGSVFEE